MKNKTIVKIFTIAILVTMLFSVASTVLGYDISDVEANYTGTVGEKTQSVTAQIIGVVQIIGISIAVIMLIYLGIKYVSAAPNEKAEVKKGAMIYVAGAVLMLATSAILQLIKGFAEQVTTL